MLQRLADELRSLLPVLVSAGGNEDEGIKRWIVCWDNLANEFAQQTNWEVDGGRWQYKLDFMLDCVIMSSVASAGHLNDIFARALRSALPPHIAQDILQRVVSERRLSIPSAPSVSRHRLTLHLAFLLHVRQVNEQMLDCTTGPPARYHTADASPQGGREWFLSGALLIPAASLAKAFAVATTLCLEPCSPAAVEAATFLESAISRRACCPVALGSARASVCHKMHAQLHALRLEHASWDSVAAAVRSSVSWLTDFGTESGLCEVPPFHVSDLFPWHFHFSSVTSNIDDQINAPDAPIAVDPVPCEFAFEACEGGEADDAMEFDWRSDADTGSPSPAPDTEVAPASDEQPVIDWSASLQVVGLLHILHNVTQELGTVMDYAPQFIDGLACVCDMLSRKWSKQRLQMTCFSRPPASLQWDDFEAFSATVYRGRWASVTDAAFAVHPLENALRFAWDATAYGMGSSGNAGSGREHPQDTALLADETIRSEFWWRYLEMWLSLADVIQHCMRWAESCPCHCSRELGMLSLSFHRKRAHRFAATGVSACPLRGCQGPELAVGEFLPLLDSLLNRSGAHLVMAVGRRLDEVQQHRLLADWERGSVLGLKLSCWGQLPLTLVGIAHHCEDIARRAAGKALQLFESLGDSWDHHTLSLLLMGHTSPVRPQLQAFAAGVSRDSVPLVLQHAARLRFIVVSERWIEGRHALSQKTFARARHHAPPLMGLAIHMSDIRAVLETAPSALLGLAAHAASVRTPLLAVEALGLRGHPVVQRLLDGVPPAKQARVTIKARKQIVEAIYHCDGPTLFDTYELPHVPQRPDWPHRRAQAMGDHGDLQALECHYAIECLRERFREFPPLSVYSFSLRPGNVQLDHSMFAEVSDHLNPSPDTLAWLDPSHPAFCFQDPDAWQEVEPVPGSVERARRVVAFFRLVSVAPALYKQQRGSPMSRLDSSAIAISLHDILEYSQPTRTFVVQSESNPGTQGSSGARLFLLASVGLNCLSSIRRWESADRFEVRLLADALPADLQLTAYRLLSTMVTLGCLPHATSPEFETLSRSGAGCVDNCADAILELLSAQGLVYNSRSSQDGVTRWWRFSELGVQRMQVGTSVSTPSTVLSVRDCALEDMCVWELWKHLLQQGWEVRVVQRRRGRGILEYPDAYRLGEPKLWLVAVGSATIQKLYLLSLAKADAHQKDVLHFKQAKWYQALLDGRDPVEATSKPASFRHSPSPQPLQCRDDCSCVCV